ncbi:MAG: carboxypeptidase regulatory-like domain-containing protein [Candidatus Binatia bacterium]
MRNIGISCVAALLVVVFSGAAWSQQTAAAPAEENYQGVPFRSGGVGRDEREALERASGGYNLKLIFARKQHTAFVSDVQVRITDSQGNVVLDGLSHGPWFFTRLPPGKYRVEAAIAGRTQEQPVEVKEAAQARLAYYWDIEPDPT